MVQKIDLHLHTHFSDGSLSPEEIVLEAQKKGYEIISICDHDCVDGIEPAIQIGLKYGIRVIPGVEITAEKEHLEIHILGYFINHKDEKLREALSIVRDSRVGRIHKMIEKLKEHGVSILPEEVFKYSKEGSIGRPHLAKALVEKGVCASADEAFRKFLGDKASCYVARFNLVPDEAIKIILDAGGIPVYAHPKVIGRDDFIPDFMKAGLRGLEAYHSDHNKKDTAYYIELARENNLLVTGGSDFHGDVKKNVYIGRINIPYALVEELEKEKNRIQGAS